MDNPYAGAEVAFLTQHGKEAIVAPVLAEALACRVARVEGFDTDTLGTFTRDVARPGTQREAARRKARLGMDLAKRRIGLGSEGSFAPDPATGLLPWNIEVLVWLDDDRGLEVVGVAEGPVPLGYRQVDSLEGLRAFAEASGFPDQHLVLRPNDASDARLRKGLRDWNGLAAAFEWARALAVDGAVFAEHDLRAHASPLRRQRIHEAAQDLARKLLSRCPSCEAPGFRATQWIGGRPCRACGAPTRQPVAERWRCEPCGHQEDRAIADPTLAEPGRCNFCNP